MNFPLALTSRTRLFLTAVAALAAVAILAGIAAGSADARGGGGGLSPNGGVSGKDGETPVPGAPPAADETTYVKIWNSTTPADRRWAKTTSQCESGGDPQAIGGGGVYRGAFQFMKSTWRTSPKSPGGDPISYSYKTQAVVAILLKKRDGADHWPVCG